MRFRNHTAGALYRAAAVLFAVFLLIRPGDAYEGAVDGLLLWYQNVLPVQLPFFIAVRLLRDSGCFDKLAAVLDPVMRKVFHVPGEAALALAAGWISGYPTGGQMALKLYEEKKLNTGEYMHVLRFSNVPGPLFVVTTVGIRFLGDVRMGYILLVSQLAASLTCGFLLRPKERPERQRNPERKPKDIPLGCMMRTAVDESISTVVMVGGFIVLFSVILAWLPEHWLVLGLEMTNGCAVLSKLPGWWKVVPIGFLMGWGGACIMLQIAAAVQDGPPLTVGYWGSRLIMGGMAGIISGILTGFLNV